MQRCHNYKINCGVNISKEQCRGSGQGGFEQRIEVFVKSQKQNREVGGARGRVGGGGTVGGSGWT